MYRTVSEGPGCRAGTSTVNTPDTRWTVTGSDGHTYYKVETTVNVEWLDRDFRDTGAVFHCTGFTYHRIVMYREY